MLTEFEIMFNSAKLIDPTLGTIDLEGVVWEQLESRMKIKFCGRGQYESLRDNWIEEFPVESAIPVLRIAFLYQYLYLNFLRVWNGQHWMA